MVALRPPQNLPFGTHASLRFADERHAEAVVRRIVGGALRRRARVVLLAPPASARRLAGDVGAGDHARPYGPGQLEVRTLSEPLDEQREAETLESTVQQALHDGFAGLVVYVEAPLLADRDAVGTWVRLELELSRLAATYPFAAVCGFDGHDRGPRASLVEALHREELSNLARTSTFSLSVKTTGALELDGELDAFCVADFNELLEATQAGRVHVLDLAGLHFVDLAGAAALHHWCAGTCRLESPPPILERIWRFLGLDEAIAS